MNPRSPFATIALTLIAAVPAASGTPPAERLGDTGLYVPGTRTIHPDVVSFTPQYPLWSDGAAKRRWLYLPKGRAIDASSPDAWEFPPGTKLWKEFSHGQPVETRLIERTADGAWRFAVYVWNAAMIDAALAPEGGIRGHAVATAPGGRYDIPSRDDCRACHEGAAKPVLGLSALQLSPDRDDLAPHAEPVRDGDVDLEGLIARGWLVNAPVVWRAEPPRIGARSRLERAALGYLHANCGHCHNAVGPLAELGLVLAQTDGAIDQSIGTIHGRPSDFRLPGAELRVAPGRPEASVLVRRMRSRHPIAQMPPLGTRLVDAVGIGLIEDWIQLELTTEDSER